MLDAQFAAAASHMAGSKGGTAESLAAKVLAAGTGFGNHEAVAHLMIEMYGDGTMIQIPEYQLFLDHLRESANSHHDYSSGETIKLDEHLIKDALLSAIEGIFEGDM